MNIKNNAFLTRWLVNFLPCIRRTGGRVIYISKDFHELTVRLKLTWRTRNIMGTIFGGSMYASTDPFYMIMLMQILGENYVVWDKGCSFRFKRPAKETIYAKFKITPEMLKTVMEQVEAQGEHTFTWPLEYKNEKGDVFVEFEKMLYVAKKEVYDEKLRRRKLKSQQQKSL